jgi:hypothetical protein
MVEMERVNSQVTKIFLICLAALVLIDGFRVPSTADPGPIGGILCTVAFLYRAFIKPCPLTLVTVFGLPLAVLVIVGNHKIAHSNLWALLLFTDTILFLYWEYLFRGRDA